MDKLKHVPPRPKVAHASACAPNSASGCDAIRGAVLAETERRARAGYSAHPDSEMEADDWSTAEEYHS